MIGQINLTLFLTLGKSSQGLNENQKKFNPTGNMINVTEMLSNLKSNGFFDTKLVAAE